MLHKLCPECKGNLFEHDVRHGEIVCRKCGLVLVAPAVAGLEFPYFLVIPLNKKFTIKLFDRYVHVDIMF